MKKPEYKIGQIVRLKSWENNTKCDTLNSLGKIIYTPIYSGTQFFDIRSGRNELVWLATEEEIELVDDDIAMLWMLEN